MRPWKPRRALTHNLLVMPLNNCGYKAVRLSEQPAKREQLCGLGEVGCSLRRVASSALSPRRARCPQREAGPRSEAHSSRHGAPELQVVTAFLL